MKTKICSKCGKKKFINNFFKNKTRKDGLSYWCKKCDFARVVKWKKENPHTSWVIDTVAQHKRRGFKVLFKPKDLLPIAKQTTYCPLCNVKLNFGYGNKGNRMMSPSLDRINNERILTLQNIQIICNKCNGTKQNRTMKEFIEYCKMVSKKFK